MARTEFVPAYLDTAPTDASGGLIGSCVNGSETMFPTTKSYHVEIAAEAREQYNEVFVSEEHPEEFYIKPKDCYMTPWNRHDDWMWNRETLTWLD